MRIALDAMGSDRAPAVEVEGAVGALRELDGDFTVVLVGDREAIEAELARYPDVPRERVEVVHASQVIEMGEAPAQAIRRKQDSSIVVGLGLHKRGEADAFISAGSTGAVMAGSLFILRPLPGVDRPAIGTVFPTAEGRTIVVDSGANVDTRPQHLQQFARLGTIYAQDALEVDVPRVGLLNIGEEPEKGDERSVETYQLLASTPGIDFVGNVEGRDIISGRCDVLVCDGFVGNVLLKFYESIAGFIIHLMRTELDLAGKEAGMERVVRTLDYTESGGAPLLGVNGITIICHGGSPPRAIRNAIRLAVHAAERGLVAHMARELARPAETSEAQ
ncbi:MAG TPA: phosphate acyltransferase PlsX [Longimicrobiaceae bacterium]|jgi:glycerol-3-phosphate acyltransferase PlsX|nr:phosphate acyltransferase PlsX [Longimicrobiaceae bacterium]